LPIYRVPPLYCPYPSGINPFTDEVERESVRYWSELLGLKPGSPARQKLEVAQFGVFIGRNYPRVTQEDLQLILDFTVWFFFWDDLCDEGLRSDPELIDQMNAEADGVLLGSAPEPTAGPLLQSLWGIRQRLGRRMHPRGLVRFVRNLQDCLESMVWQASERRQGIVQSRETYERFRRLSGGVIPMLDMIEMGENVLLPINVRYHPSVAKLMRCFNNLLCWANDIFSAAKEMEHQDEHNIVCVIACEEGAPVQRAVNRAAQIHDREMLRFEELLEAIPSFNPQADADLRRVIASMRSWLRGNIDWSTATKRYGHLASAPAVALELRAH
jgi:hypothetical protein